MLSATDLRGEIIGTHVPGACGCGVCSGALSYADGRSFLEVALAEATKNGMPANGIDLDPASIGLSGLTTEGGDGFELGRGEATSAITTANATPPGDFDIIVEFQSPVTAAQEAAFAQAELIWESIILGDVADTFVSGYGPVDDLVIFSDLGPIDGPGNILGQAGPFSFRGSGIPRAGSMDFDSADLASLEQQGLLTDVIVHEMGHVLGVGTIWGSLGLRQGAGTSNPRYIGSEALAEYNTFVDNNTSNIPLANVGGPGSRDSHWRESTFNNELMSPNLNGGSNPLSRMTAASLIDYGYTNIDLDATDFYELPGGNDAPRLFGLGTSVDPVPDGGTVTLSVPATDTDSGMDRVEFWLDSNGRDGLQRGTNNPDTLLGVDSTPSGSTYSVELPASDFEPGDNTVIARGFDQRNLGSSDRSTIVSREADLVGPEVTDTAVFLEQSQQLRFTFGERTEADPVVSDLTLTNLTTGQVVPTSTLSLQVVKVGQVTVATFSYDVSGNGPLANGNYRATLAAGAAEDAAGNGSLETVIDFAFVNGDADGSGTVNLADFGVLRANFGQNGRTFSEGDFNYDGLVNLADFGILRGNFGFTLPSNATAIFSDSSVDDEDERNV
jgi:hypothetical protein